MREDEEMECPFCGGRQLSLSGDAAPIDPEYWIECCKCETRGPVKMSGEEAADAWYRGMVGTMKPYPRDVCLDCGQKYRNDGSPYCATMITMSYGKCDVCGEENTGITTPGDFGYPDFPGHEKLKRKPMRWP